MAGNDLVTVDEKLMALFEETDTDGFENTTSDDYGRVQIKQIQTNNSGKYEGSKVGQLVNTATGELMDEVVFIPCSTSHDFPEYTEDFKFVTSYKKQHPAVQTAKTDKSTGRVYNSENGNSIVDTFTIWALIMDDDGEYSPAVISCTGKSITPYRKFINSLRAIRFKDKSGKKVTSKLFQHTCRMTTEIVPTPKNPTVSVAKFGFEKEGNHKNSLITDIDTLKLAIEMAERAKETAVNFTAPETPEDEF